MEKMNLQTKNLTDENGKTVTLYAIYGLHQYTLTFDSDGGSSVSPQTIDKGSMATLPEDPVKEGYEFTGWQPTIDIVTKDQEYKAIFKYASCTNFYNSVRTTL